MKVCDNALFKPERAFSRFIIMRILLFVSLLPFTLYSQDTAVFWQENGDLFSDSYTFYRKNSTDKVGFFKHVIFTDDVQTWYGKGEFIERKGKYKLYYQQHFDTLTVKISVDSSKKSDSILFINNSPTWFPCCFYFPKYPEEAFFYFVDIEQGSSFISKKDLLRDTFWLSNNSSLFINIPNTDRLISIYIEYYPQPYRCHLLTPKKVEKLRKNKKGFKVKALFSGKRREQFVSR